jgi:hypothetical protein
MPVVVPAVPPAMDVSAAFSPPAQAPTASIADSVTPTIVIFRFIHASCSSDAAVPCQHGNLVEQHSRDCVRPARNWQAKLFHGRRIRHLPDSALDASTVAHRPLVGERTK